MYGFGCRFVDVSLQARLSAATGYCHCLPTIYIDTVVDVIYRGCRAVDVLSPLSILMATLLVTEKSLFLMDKDTVTTVTTVTSNLASRN